MMEELQNIRKLLADKYKKGKSTPNTGGEIKKTPTDIIKVVNHIYLKSDENYYIVLNNVITRIHGMVFDRTYGMSGKPLSEFGKTVEYGYIKTIENDQIFKVGDSTFILPFTQIRS